MKKRSMILLAACFLLTGCTDTAPPQPESAAGTEPAAETEPAVEYDHLDYKSFDDYAFLAFRTPEPADSGSAWLTADRWVPVWNFEPETDYPEGSFVKIVADVTILDGGEAGYSNEPEIHVLKDVQPVTYAEALPQCDIPSENSVYGEIARKFETVGSHYLIYCDQTVYRDGEKLGTFPSSSTDSHDALAPFFECPALFDYITKDTLLSFEEHAEVITNGAEREPYDTSAVSHALFEIFKQPDLLIDANVMPLNADQIAASRESGFYAMIMVPDYDCVPLDEDSINYSWASVCSETTDGNLTVTFDGQRSVRLKPEAAEIILQACKPQETA